MSDRVEVNYRDIDSIGDDVNTIIGNASSLGDLLEEIKAPADDEVLSGCSKEMDNTDKLDDLIDSLKNLRDLLKLVAERWMDVEILNSGIADELRMYYDLINSGADIDSIDYAGMGIFYGGDYEQQIWNYLIDCGYTEEAAAAMMGNLMAESKLNPFCVQGDYKKDDPNTYDGRKTYQIDTIYTKQQFKDDTTGGGGYGLAQWTYKPRKDKLYDFAKEKGTSIGDIQTQLEFIKYELDNDYAGIGNSMETSHNLTALTHSILYDYENPEIKNESERQKYAKEMYEKYSGTHEPGEPSTTGNTVKPVKQNDDSDSVYYNNHSSEEDTRSHETEHNVTPVLDKETTESVTVASETGNQHRNDDVEPVVQQKSNDELSNEVIEGKWGAGQDRKDRLEQAGYDYRAIQDIVNEKVKNPNYIPEDTSGGTSGYVTRHIDTDNSTTSGNISADEPKVEQAKPLKSNEEISNEVIAGKWGYGQDRIDKLEEAGYDYRAIQDIVNEKTSSGTTLGSHREKH